ncbi:MAG: caspase family protein, partial [Clostridia bacterium]|nr:caspase family protein [Clostridia bacterium]
TTSLTVLVSSGNRTGVTIFAWREYTGHRICSEMVETSVTCTWDGGVAVVAPASVKAELGAQDGEVIVTWDAVPGVTSYLVHPDAQSWGGDGVDVTVSGDETTCTLIVPQEAWFETATIHVASCLSDGTENGYVWSGTTAAEPLSLAFCDAPEVELTFTDNGETLSVAWEQAPEASGYRIYYRIRGEEAYTCTEAGADESSMTIAVQPCQVYEVYMTTVCTSQSLQEAESAAGEVQSIYTFDNGWYELIPDVTFAPGGETTVTWEAVEDAAGYNVRYAATEDPTDANTFHVAADEATSLTFALPVGETYDIEVEAYIEHTDGDDTWTYCLASGSTTVTVENVPALAAPEVIVETAEYGTQLWFYWEPVADAAGYNIYFSKRGDDTLYRSRMAADRTEAGFLVDPNCVYDAYMTTVGLDEEGIEFESLPSEKQSVYTFALGEGSEISLDVIAAYDGDVILYWDAVPGATGYDVSYTNANKSGDAGAVTLGADATSARFTLTVGQEYNLKVTAYAKHTEGTDTWQHKIADGCGNAVAKNGATVTLDVPTMTVSCGKEGYISISWTKVPNATRHGVYLYNVTQDKWASVFPERRITSWDFPVTEGDTYKMYVRGIYDHGDGTVFYGTSCLIQTVVANTGVGTYRALLIGNTYPGEGDTYLPGPDADARAMKSMLATMTGTPYTATVKTNLTASGMTSAIASAFAGATANDVSLLFYSGHGVYSEETEYLGALYGTGSTMLTINQLRAALDQIPGKKIVIMDSCHSGAAIGKSVTISSSGYTAVQNLSNAFNSAVISAFASRSKANLATSDYYVMTASHSTEESQSVTWNGTDYVGLFAYAMMKGCGYDSRNSASISSLYADTNGDKQISLAEAYAYGYANAKTYNSNQNAQVYPTGSSFVLWGR